MKKFLLLLSLIITLCLFVGCSGNNRLPDPYENLHESTFENINLNNLNKQCRMTWIPQRYYSETEITPKIKNLQDKYTELKLIINSQDKYNEYLTDIYELIYHDQILMHVDPSLDNGDLISQQEYMEQCNYYPNIDFTNKTLLIQYVRGSGSDKFTPHVYYDYFNKKVFFVIDKICKCNVEQSLVQGYKQILIPKIPEGFEIEFNRSRCIYPCDKQ